MTGILQTEAKKRVPSFVAGLPNDLAIGLLLGLWVLLLRMPSFLTDHLGSDEGLYLTIAVRMLAGDWLYTDVWDNKPPGIYLIYMLAARMFGQSQFAVSLASFLAVWATSLIILRMGGRGIGTCAATIAAFVFPCFMLDMEALGANAENFYIVCDTMSASILLAYASSSGAVRTTLRAAILFGFIQGAAFQIKFLTIFETAGMALVLAALIVAKRRAASAVIVSVVAGLVAFALPTLGVLAAFSFGGHLGDAIYAMFVVPRLYVQSPFGIAKGWSTLDYLVRRLSYFAPMFVAGGLALLGVIARRLPWSAEDRWGIWLIGAWLGGATLSAISTGLFSYHYFIAVAPAASLLGGWAVAKLTRGFRLSFTVAVAAGTVCLAITPVVAMMRKEAAGLGAPRAMTQGMLAAEIAHYVPPGTRIFGTDQSPILYALSDTVPATRFPFPYHIFERPALYGVDPLKEISRTFESPPALVIGSRKLLFEDQRPVGLLLRSELKEYREVPTSDLIRLAGVVFLCRVTPMPPPAASCRTSAAS